MARCSLGQKKLRKYSKQFSIKFVSGKVRGNTDHRVDLYSEDGKGYHYFKDGTFVELGTNLDHDKTKTIFI